MWLFHQIEVNAGDIPHVAFDVFGNRFFDPWKGFVWEPEGIVIESYVEITVESVVIGAVDDLSIPFSGRDDLFGSSFPLDHVLDLHHRDA